MTEQEFIPVYMLTGFLESGKTTMIQSMLSDENFSSGQRTLIVCCEDGEMEYEPDFLKKYNIKPSKARRILREANIERPYKRWEWDQEEHDKILTEVVVLLGGGQEEE